MTGPAPAIGAAPTGGRSATAVYLALTALILLLYVAACLSLRPFAGDIVGGIVEFAIPGELYLRLALLLIAGILVALFLRRQAVALLRQMPVGLRGLLLPLPFYLLVTLDWLVSLVLLATGGLAWTIYEPLARLLGDLLRLAPPVLARPVVPFWSVVLYAALFSQEILPTAVTALLMGALFYLEGWMESYFAPVWSFLRALPAGAARSIRLARLVVGLTAPFVFAYWWGLFNPLSEPLAPLLAAAVFFITFFIVRGPRPAASPAPRA